MNSSNAGPNPTTAILDIPEPLVLTTPTTSRNKGQWRVTESLLQALAFLLIENQGELDKSRFQEFIDNNEFGLALDELAAVVNHQGEDVMNAGPKQTTSPGDRA